MTTTELNLLHVDRHVEDLYNRDDEFNAYILVCSAFHNTEVFVDYKGRLHDIYALMNAIIRQLAIKSNMTTLDVIELIREGQLEYDEIIGGKNKCQNGEH